MQYQRGYLETRLDEMENPAKADATILAHLARGIDLRVGYETGCRILNPGKTVGGHSASPEGDVEGV